MRPYVYSRPWYVMFYNFFEDFMSWNAVACIPKVNEACIYWFIIFVAVVIEYIM